MKKARFLTYSALLAALYAALCYLQNFLVPNSANWAIQFRAAEALCVLALFTPAAVSGLTIGCFLYNISFAGALPLDPIFGTAATFFAVGSMYLLRKVRIKGYPLLALLMPALWNALLVGWELQITLGGSFGMFALYVAIGEVAVLFTLGTVLFYVLRNRNLNRLFQ